MTHAVAPLAAERTIDVTMERDGRKFKARVGGGTKLQRVRGALTIVRYNRATKRFCEREGHEFPAGAPLRARDVDWKSVLKKGNI